MGIEQNHRQFRGVFTGFQPEIVAGTMRGQLVRQKAGFHGQTAQPRATKIKKSGCALLRIYQRIIGEQLSDAENTKRL